MAEGMGGEFFIIREAGSVAVDDVSYSLCG